MKDRIAIRNARQNNLKGIDLDLPRRSLVVVTGPSGSGKSSLAFDTIYAEGQRRYVESLSTYAKQFLERMEKPAVDRVEGISPAVAIQQRNPTKTSRSTVGTATEVYDYMRLLWARAGRTLCPECGREVTPDTVQSAAEETLRLPDGTRLMVTFPLPRSARVEHKRIVENLRELGFIRVLAGGETLDLDIAGAEDAAEFGHDLADPDELLVVVDRLVARPEDEEVRGRLVDSIATAFAEGEGEAVIVVPDADDLRFTERFRCSRHPDVDFVDPSPRLFSFNNPYGSCPECTGFGATLEYDLDLIIPAPDRSIRGGAVDPWEAPRYNKERARLREFANDYDVPVDEPWSDLPDSFRDDVLHGSGDFTGVLPFLRSRERKRYKQYIRVFLRKYQTARTCAACDGAKLRPEALYVKVAGRDIAQASALPIDRLRRWVEAIAGTAAPDPGAGDFESSSDPEVEGVAPSADPVDGDPVPSADSVDERDTTEPEGDTGKVEFAGDDSDGAANAVLSAHDREIAATILRELSARLRFLDEVGLGYLSLHRQTRTLSGGEAQRISLANSLGANLMDTLYVLDEPTIGLHPRDNDRLIHLLRQLRAAGNAVLVVEHDPAAIEAADEIVELGPGSGERGGEVVFQGDYAALLESGTATGRYLADGNGSRPPDPIARRDVDGRRLRIEGARLHNLRGITAEIPLGALTVVTGVSGSGKSTLVHDVVYRALEMELKGETSAKEHLGEPVGEYETLEGTGAVEAAVLVDQSPIGRTPRSNPVTYIKAFKYIRKLFAEQPLSKNRDFDKGTFSFNTKGGRCEVCKGDGVEQIEMVFMADVYVPCDACGGKRYAPETLEVKYKGLNIREVLDLTVDEAIRFFIKQDRLGKALWYLQQVGLGYLRLGQPAPTLSGGEAQRMKIARELIRAGKKRGRRIYLLDEPTTGLSGAEVRQLLEVLGKLLDAGHTVVVIEHNLAVIRAADWLIDLGPEAGADGGEVVATGRPEEVAEVETSHTGRYLREVLGKRAVGAG